MKIAILGNGGFGTAMAIAQSRAGHAVALWGHDAAYTAELARTRSNPRYLEDVTLPPEVRVTGDANEALRDAEVVLGAVPTQFLRSALQTMRGSLKAGVPVISLAKGLEQDTGRRPSQIVAELLPGRPVLVLSGPSHAEEIARFLPTTVVLAGSDAACVRTMQEALATPRLRIYRGADPLGVELCGALKNVMALAAGIADGLGYGDNAKAAILSRGVVEMARYGVAEGADRATFFGLAGVGDLAVTAFSRHGRNRAFGERIGKGMTVEQALAASRKVAEGVWTSRVVAARAKELKVEMPIAEGVVAVLFGGRAPAEAVKALMERDPKAEV